MLVIQLHLVVFSTSLFFTMVKSSLAKMLAKKGVVDNQTNAYIMRTSVHGLSGVAERGCTDGSCKSKIGTFFGRRSEIRKIKQRSYALDRPKYDPGIWSVAAPVSDHNRLVIASLAIIAPSIRTSGMKFMNLILEP